MDCLVIEVGQDHPDLPSAAGLDSMCLDNKARFQIYLLDPFYNILLSSLDSYTDFSHIIIYFSC